MSECCKATFLGGYVCGNNRPCHMHEYPDEREDYLRSQLAKAERDRNAFDSARIALVAENERQAETIEELRKPIADVRVRGSLRVMRESFLFRGDGALEESAQIVCEALEKSAAAHEATKRERDEARDWVRKLTREYRVVTCIYCGHAYPSGSPTHGAEALKTHTMACEKHPLSTAIAALARYAVYEGANGAAAVALRKIYAYG